MKSSRSTHLKSLPAPHGRMARCIQSAAAIALAIACLALVKPASAQQPETTTPASTSVPLLSPQVGDATRELLARQASGTWASPTPRPIAGDVAQKSYERYIKSFEYAIPETFSTTVKSSGTASP